MKINIIQQMISTINKFFEQILSFPKSFYISLCFFTFKDAIKLPIFVRYNTILRSLRGKIIISGGVHYKMMMIGFTNIGIIDKSQRRTILELDGNIVLRKDNIFIGSGSRISIGKNATVVFEGIFNNTASMELIVTKSISFGHDVLISWDTLIMDTDFHSTIDTITHDVSTRDKGITIGNNVWIGARSTILKGSHIPDGCVIACGAIVNKKTDTPNSLIAGNPSMVRKNNITRCN